MNPFILVLAVCLFSLASTQFINPTTKTDCRSCCEQLAEKGINSTECEAGCKLYDDGRSNQIVSSLYRSLEDFSSIDNGRNVRTLGVTKVENVVFTCVDGNLAELEEFAPFVQEVVNAETCQSCCLEANSEFDVNRLVDSQPTCLDTCQDFSPGDNSFELCLNLNEPDEVFGCFWAADFRAYGKSRMLEQEIFCLIDGNVAATGAPTQSPSASPDDAFFEDVDARIVFPIVAVLGGLCGLLVFIAFLRSIRKKRDDALTNLPQAKQIQNTADSPDTSTGKKNNSSHWWKFWSKPDLQIVSMSINERRTNRPSGLRASEMFPVNDLARHTTGGWLGLWGRGPSVRTGTGPTPNLDSLENEEVGNRGNGLWNNFWRRTDATDLVSRNTNEAQIQPERRPYTVSQKKGRKFFR
eukprot:maker-scaffold_18-snap-gene-2.61-mRNA-1 protein AED:0.12 eAED:0.12 QI:128/1/1/1/0/0/2/176/409